MADHSYFEELIGCELDGELRAEERAALDAHLKECEACRRYRELLRSVSEAIPGETAAVPETLSRSVMARIHAMPKEEEKPAAKGMRWGKKQAALSVAAAVVVLASFGVTRLTTMRAGSAAPAEAPMMMAAPAAGVMRDSMEEAAPAEAAEEEAPAETENVILFSEHGEEPASAEAEPPAAAAPKTPAVREKSDPAKKDTAAVSEASAETEEGAPLAPGNEAEWEEESCAAEANGISPQDLLLAVIEGDEPAEKPERDADLICSVDGTEYAFWYEEDILLFSEVDSELCFESHFSVSDFLYIIETLGLG